MEALNDAVKAGKVLYLGGSSMFAWQFAQLQMTAEANGWAKFISMQNHCDLVYREEREMNPYCLKPGHRRGINLPKVSVGEGPKLAGFTKGIVCQFSICGTSRSSPVKDKIQRSGPKVCIKALACLPNQQNVLLKWQPNTKKPRRKSCCLAVA